MSRNGIPVRIIRERERVMKENSIRTLFAFRSFYFQRQLFFYFSSSVTRLFQTKILFATITATTVTLTFILFPLLIQFLGLWLNPIPTTSVTMSHTFLDLKILHSLEAFSMSSCLCRMVIRLIVLSKQFSKHKYFFILFLYSIFFVLFSFYFLITIFKLIFLQRFYLIFIFFTRFLLFFFFNISFFSRT